MTKSTNLSIAKPDASAKLSAPRKQFNSLVKKLDTLRSMLARWHATMPQLHAKANGEMQPLVDQFDVQRKKMVMHMDGMFEHKLLSKRDRTKLCFLIPDLVSDLLAKSEDEELEAILEKYEDENAPEQPADEAEFMKTLDEIFGRFDDDTADRNAAGADGHAGADHAEHFGANARPKKGRKAAGESARELRQQEEDAKLKQSSRDVFRKLASVLHPDREQDPAERLRKTELMQRANAAYEKNDFLGLLELQLEVEPVDANTLARLSDEQIKRYNQVLKRQVEEVDGELAHFEGTLLFSLRFNPFDRPTPEELLNIVDTEIAEMKMRLVQIESDLVDFQDIKKFKAFLKDFRLPKPQPNDMFYF